MKGGKKYQKNPEELEKHKIIAMWSGVIFFMLIIVVFWIYNTKTVFRESMAKNNDQSISNLWNSEDFDEIMTNLRENMDKFEELRLEMGSAEIGTGTSNVYSTSSLPISEKNATSTDLIGEADSKNETSTSTDDKVE